MSNIFRKQLAQLKANYPDGKGRLFKCKGEGIKLQWRQLLQPTKFSRAYSTQVTWSSQLHLPEVEIIAPQLIALAKGKRSPHDFSSKGNSRPCLMFNNGSRREWTPSMSIAESIIPWTLEWLHYWELWLVEGKWLGGGVHVGELTLEQYRIQHMEGNWPCTAHKKQY